MTSPTCQLPELLDARVFRALADPQRLAILTELTTCCGEPQTVGGIAASQPVHDSVVSRHLAVLRDAGLLACRREGREAYYTVRYGALIDLLRRMADAIESCCPPADAPAGEHSAIENPTDRGKEVFR